MTEVVKDASVPPLAGAGIGRRRSTQRTSSTTRAGNNIEQNREELPRAASYTYLPSAKGSQLTTSVVDIKVFPEATYAVSQSEDVQDISPSDTSPLDSSGWNTPDDHAPTAAPPRARDITAQLRKSLSKKRHDSPNQSLRNSAESTAQSATHTVIRRPSINKSFSRRFNRNSWISTTSSTPSRSPSPHKRDVPSKHDSATTDLQQSSEGRDEGRRKSLLTRSLTMTRSSKDAKDKKEKQLTGGSQELQYSVTRRDTFLRRKSTGRVVPLLTKSKPDEPKASMSERNAPAVPAIPKSFSTDKLPMMKTSTPSLDRAAPVPRLLSTEKFHSTSPLSLTKKKDELWSMFRTLDADFSKFSSKSSAFKANVVRSSLLPFLKTYATHPSNRTLRLEDLDRRTNILNKWWTGLVELLHGRNNQSISGTDRPTILEGVSGIMERPEWRLHPSPFCALDERVHATLANGNRSHTSLGSTSSDFLAESVHHNVRNIFVQNLTSQMAFVVDKMSSRNASASLVNFCGRACAYAFMFVPGMCDVLVRLWDLPMDILRRVLHEHGVGKFDELAESVSERSVDFPPALQQLSFSSLTKFIRKLRTPPPLPPGTNHIDWWGHWVERWSGRESDLFYVFVKQFHVLLTDFLPSSITKLERLAIPGLLPVHAQLLSNLDATIHRDLTQIQQDSAVISPSSTFDELLGDPDAIASALPVPPINATRLMAENRLIMLLRDFLSDRTMQRPMAKEIFAQSFSDLLQAAARGTSLFDHSACYTLLDFLEESFVILARFEQHQEPDTSFIDSAFWQSVFRKMMKSENTMTEIRLYTFLYTLWNVIIGDPVRRSNMCLELLLEPEVFESRFNHWCPMVRAYYMRLLCWRLARYDNEESAVHLDLLETVHARLIETWSHYLFLCEKADKENALRPATNPCHPASGRRLLIVRTDNQINNAGSFLTFEGLVRDSPSQMAKPAWKRTGSTNVLDACDSRPESACSTLDSESDTPQKGIGGFLKKMMGGGKSRSKSREPEASSSSACDASGSTAVALQRSATDDGHAREGKPTQPPSHRSLSFKFSLEFHPNTKQLPPMRLIPPRLPPPAQNYLQAHSKKSFSAETLMRSAKPVGDSITRARYSGRALAEWTIVVSECHSFFERRKKEGAPSNKHVETPTLGVEVFKRPS